MLTTEQIKENYSGHSDRQLDQVIEDTQKRLARNVERWPQWRKTEAARVLEACRELKEGKKDA